MTLAMLSTFTPTPLVCLAYASTDTDTLLRAIVFAAVILTLAVALTLFRLVKGPHLADRVAALEALSIISVGIISLYSILSGELLLLDAAAVVALVSFLGTVAFATFIDRGG